MLKVYKKFKLKKEFNLWIKDKKNVEKLIHDFPEKKYVVYYNIHTSQVEVKRTAFEDVKNRISGGLPYLYGGY